MQGLKTVGEYARRTDKLYWFLMLAVSAYSLLLLRTVPPDPDSGKSYFATMLLAVAVGYLGAVVLTLVDYHEIASFWYIIAGFCLFLMLYTLQFGISVQNSGGVNAKAWIDLKVTTFQPSELVKIGFMVTFGKHLAALEERGLLKSPLHVILLACHALVPIALVHLQNDDGAGIIFFCMFVAMAFAAGIQLRYFAILFAGIGVALPLAWKYDVFSYYQKQRILVTYHLDESLDIARRYGYQQIQGRTSIGSGGLLGRGLFQSPRVNSRMVPVQESDYIFSVAGEQLGFIGCLILILLLVFLLWRTLAIARKSPDLLGKTICMGFFGMIASQMLFNIGMCLDLLPVVGITLPFFSAGGSSAACLYFGFGLVQNVYMHRTSTDKVKLKHPLSGSMVRI